MGYNNAVQDPIDISTKLKKDNSLPEITDLIYHNSERNKLFYNEYLNNAVKPSADEFTALGANLEKKFNQIITTNFDNVFDSIIEYNETNDRKEIVYPAISSSQFTGKVIAYMHGKVTNGSVIFREDEYIKAYRDPKIKRIETFLRDIITNKTLLFIGFSFNDEDFKKLLTKLIDDVIYEAKTLEDTYGKSIDDINLKKIYVIYTAEEIRVEKFEKKNINIDNFNTEINKLFDVKNDTEKKLFKLKDNISWSYSNELLKDDKYKDFKSIVDSLFKIRSNMNCKLPLFSTVLNYKLFSFIKASWSK